ncbi:MAG: preprotein translocase subunit YajC [Acidiferrobacteraceae bacterium]
MSLPISDALAAAAPAGPAPGGASSLITLAPFVLFFIVAYFLLMRPQQKRMKEHRELLAALTKGDEVATSGGLLGRVLEVGDVFVTIEIAANVPVKVQKHAVQSLLPKGTLKI